MRVGYVCRFLEKGVKRRRGLATTTAGAHEVQGRGLAGDRHVGFSVHQMFGGGAGRDTLIAIRWPALDSAWRRS